MASATEVRASLNTQARRRHSSCPFLALLTSHTPDEAACPRPRTLARARALAPSPSPGPTQMVRRVIKLHESAMKKIFRKHAKADKNKETMELQEFLDLFHASGTVDSRGGPLTPKRVQETFILSQLDEGMVEVRRRALPCPLLAASLAPVPGALLHLVVSRRQVWRTAKDPCTTLIFPEFMEAIGRAALFKFEVDKISTVERKMHEMCQLVIASPVGKVSGAQPQAAPNPTTPARSERRRAIMPEMAGQSMHSVLKYKPAEGAPA